MTNPLLSIFGLRNYLYADPSDFVIGTLLSNALTIAAGVIALIEYVWRPIDCVLPAQSAHLTAYVRSYCFNLHDVYLATMHDRTSYDDVPKTYKRYESWLPVLLLWQAILLRLPRYIWILVSKAANVNLDNLINAATSYKDLDESGRRAACRTTAQLLYANYTVRENPNATTTTAGLRAKLGRCGNTMSRYLAFGMMSVFYAVVCLFYALSVKHAFNELCEFLGLSDEKKYDYGLTRMKNALPTGNRTTNDLAEQPSIVGVFPTVILCEQQYSYLGDSARFTVQCHLPASIFYDRLSVALWFALLTVQPLVWIVFAQSLFIVFPWPRKWFIRRCLIKATRSVDGGGRSGGRSYEDPRRVEEFLDNHLRSDAFFILRNLRARVDQLFVLDVVSRLFADVNEETGDPYMDTNHPLKEPLLATGLETSRM